MGYLVGTLVASRPRHAAPGRWDAERRRLSATILAAATEQSAKRIARLGQQRDAADVDWGEEEDLTFVNSTFSP